MKIILSILILAASVSGMKAETMQIVPGRGIQTVKGSDLANVSFAPVTPTGSSLAVSGVSLAAFKLNKDVSVTVDQSKTAGSFEVTCAVGAALARDVARNRQGQPVPVGDQKMISEFSGKSAHLKLVIQPNENKKYAAGETYYVHVSQ
jgi:hypothetical protein